jgi:hypothetical protein
VRCPDGSRDPVRTAPHRVGAAAGENSQQQPRITAAEVDRIAAEVPAAIGDRGTLEVITRCPR